MAARGHLTRKQMKTDEFRESVVGFEQWLEENWRTLIMWLAGIAVLAALIAGWYFVSAARHASAQERLAEGLRAYRGALDPGDELEGTFDEALAVFDDVAGRMGAGPAADIAQYYRGLTLLRMGNHSEAVPALEEVVGGGGDPVLRGSAGAALARALVGAGDPDRAVETLRTVADDPAGEYPADLALLEAARIRYDQGDPEAAAEIWRELLDRFPDTSGAQEARRKLELLES
jgi:TolA-binding protein